MLFLRTLSSVCLLITLEIELQSDWLKFLQLNARAKMWGVAKTYKCQVVYVQACVNHRQPRDSRDMETTRVD